MPEIFGKYADEQPTNVEHLIIGFSPSSIPLKQRWRNNGLSADFLADYLQTFFIGETSVQEEIRSAVSYIANELLENAMKFSDESVDFATSIAFHLHSDKLIFFIKNSIPKENVEQFQNFIQELLSCDPEEMYMQQLEKNALEDSNHSGLGFLTMMQDYSAELGWKFDTIQRDGPINTVTTRVQLTLRNFKEGLTT